MSTVARAQASTILGLAGGGFGLLAIYGLLNSLSVGCSCGMEWVTGLVETPLVIGSIIGLV